MTLKLESLRSLRSLTSGGAEEDRTPDPLRAKQVLSQLSYGPNLLRYFVLLFVMLPLSFGHVPDVRSLSLSATCLD